MNLSLSGFPLILANKIHGHFMVFMVHFLAFFMVLAYKFHGHFENFSNFSLFKKKIVKQNFGSRAAGEILFIPLIFVQTLRKI